MYANVAFRLAVLLAVTALCCMTTFGVSGAKHRRGTKPREELLVSACKQVALYRVVNIPFDVIHELASNASSAVEEIKSKIDAMREMAEALDDPEINKSAESVYNDADWAEEQINTALELVRQTRVLIDGYILGARPTYNQKFIGMDGTLELVFKNSTQCNDIFKEKTNESGVNYDEMVSNTNNLTEWKERAKKIWDKPPTWASEVVEKIIINRVKVSWDSVRKKLEEQLENVAIPLVPVMFNVTTVEKKAVQIEAQKKLKTEEVTREHGILCNISKRLSLLSSALGGLEEQATKKTDELKKLRDSEEAHVQMRKKYIVALETVVPRADYGATKVISEGGNGVPSTPRLEFVERVDNGVAITAHKIKREIKEVSEGAELALKSLRGRLDKVGKRASAFSSENKNAKWICDVPVHDVTPYTLEAMTDELSNAERGIIPGDLRSNLKTVSNKWESLQKSMAELDKVAEVAKSDVNEAEMQSKVTELAVVKELAVKREEFCKVMDHLNAVKSHHNSLEARAREVQSEVQEAKKYEESAGTEAELIQKYVKKIVATGARTKAAVVRAMGACRAAEAAAAEKDADVFASAAGACVAAKRADDEGRETEKTSSAVKEFEKKSGFALVGIRESVRRTAVAEGTALKSKENITGALHKIEAVVERVNKTFNDAVTKLPGLESNGYMKECNKDGTVAGGEGTVGAFEVNMQTLLQFVNESEGSIINNSVTVLRESTKQFDNALNEAKKFSANAKSESDQVKAIRAAIKSNAHVARETVRRAEDAAREAQEAASRVASGCKPLHRQLLSVLSGAV
ncbi:hypothetical protein ERJ75_001310700 [Trypanosoma vivax]|nr:hypothetical protein ERJ75_001310700 [Trypanosoma vivax]